jgi:predicted TIM-barrel fold metal-dependent hydrolase
MTRCRRISLLPCALAFVLSSALLVITQRAEAQDKPLWIVDVHFHPAPTWDLDALTKLFDELGVAAAGNGARDSDVVAAKFAQHHPARFIPFVGNEPIRQFTSREGERAWTLQSAGVVDYLAQLETALRDKRVRGIGELVVNSVHSRSDKPARYPADSPLMRRLWALSAKYDVPLSVHLDATPDALAEMERVLASDRGGTWIWAHSGWLPVAKPSLLRRLLQAHPNLFCELSGRESIRRIYRGDPIDNDRVLKPDWKALLEDFPDRFVIGTDVDPATMAAYAEEIGYWRGILMQLSPATAARLAHDNAERLLKLAPAPAR